MGLVVVGVLGNVAENSVAIKLAYKNKMDLSISVLLNSSLQVAIFVFPLLVITSHLFGFTPIGFMVSPFLASALILTAIINVLVVLDGATVWLEGVALIALYVLAAICLWCL